MKNVKFASEYLLTFFSINKSMFSKWPERKAARKTNSLDTRESLGANWFFTVHCVVPQVNKYAITQCHSPNKKAFRGLLKTLQTKLTLGKPLFIQQTKTSIKTPSFLCWKVLWMGFLVTSYRWCKHACARHFSCWRITFALRLTCNTHFVFSLAGRMGIRWLAVLCAWALLAQSSLSFPEEEPLEELLELDEPEGKTEIFFLLI